MPGAPRDRADRSAQGACAMIIELPLDLVFRDLFYRIPAFARGNDVFLKLEGFNVTGSIKIKTAIGLVEDLERQGVAKPNETVIVEVVVGKSWIGAQLGLRRQGLQIHLRYGSKRQSRHHKRHGALWGEGRCR